jgi:hypothetical protein
MDTNLEKELIFFEIEQDETMKRNCWCYIFINI